VKRAALAIVLALSGCDGCDTAAPPPVAAPSASAVVVHGLDAADNDAALVEAARAVIAKCTFNQAGGYYTPTCDELALFTGKAMNAEATVMNMLGDDDAKIRGLAARTLSAKGKAYRSDNQQALRVIAALNAEKHQGVALQLADAVARIDASASATLDALKKVASEHPTPNVRARLIGPLLSNNRDALFAFVQTRATDDADEAVRVAAAGAFWGNSDEARVSDVCRFWLERANDGGSAKVAGKSAYFLATKKTGGNCRDQYDALLDRIAELSKSGAVGDQGMSGALSHLHGHPAATPEQKQRSFTIAKALVANTNNDGLSRAEALRFVIAESPDGKALAKKYLEDESVHVRGAAERAAK
jgi:hypothetical protein